MRIDKMWFQKIKRFLDVFIEQKTRLANLKTPVRAYKKDKTIYPSIFIGFSLKIEKFEAGVLQKKLPNANKK